MSFAYSSQTHKNDRFLREDQDEQKPNTTWEEKLASKYYSNLYREFAVCDLKHYKSGNVCSFVCVLCRCLILPQFALRWRTEDEVLSGAGETTCGNVRCKHHSASSQPSLSTLELPFMYVENDETKSALVKVVLCRNCVDKLMWKRRKEREIHDAGKDGSNHGEDGKVEQRQKRRTRDDEQGSSSTRRRTSRSRSPNRDHQKDDQRRRRRRTPP